MRALRPGLALPPVIALCVYITVAPNDLVWDSDQLCVNNPHAASLRAMLPILWPPTWEERRPALMESYRPTALLSFAIERRLWGDSPAGYHWGNALLHAANAGIVVWLALRLGATSTVGALAGLLFAVHPVTTEAVAWVSNRSILLSTGLCFLGLGVFLGPPGQRRVGPMAASAGLTLLALLSHEGVVFIPLGVGLVWLAKRRRLREWRRLMPLAIVCAAYLALRLALTSVGPPEGPIPAQDRLEPRLLSVARTAKAYAAMFAAPIHLSADRPVRPSDWRTGEGYAALGCVLLLGPVAVAAWRRGPTSACAAALALAAFAPVSNWFYLAGRPIAEQRAYPMAAGLCLCSAVWIGKRHARMCLLGALVLCALAVSRCQQWRSEGALWSATIATTPLKSRAYVNLGLTQDWRGCGQRSRSQYRRATELSPGYGLARLKWGSKLTEAEAYKAAMDVFQALPTQLWQAEYWALAGDAYWGAGEEAEAIGMFEQAAAMAPRMPHVMVRLARAYIATKRLADAEAVLRKAAERQPGGEGIDMALAELRLAQGQYARAASLFALAGQRRRDNGDAAIGLAKALTHLGEHAKAAKACRLALSADPYSAEAYELLGQALVNLGNSTEGWPYLEWAERLRR